ncbi:MAG: hypothetical protein ACFFCI_20730 [Promethearchaeota archaeon]
MAANNNDQLRPLIIDIGHDNFRFGWAGNDFPDIIAPSVYVSSNDFLFTSEVIDGLEEIFIHKEDNIDNLLYGNEALKYSNILKVHEFKKENNYKILMKFFQHYYYQLKIEEEYQFRQPIIILSPFFMSELEKTKMREIFLNLLGFPSILFLEDSQGILSTLQKTSIVIINMGEVNTYITTFLHGFTNIMARDTFPVAGKDLTNHFLNILLTKKGSGRIEYLDHLITNEIKEKFALCILDTEEEIKRIKDGFTKYNSNIDLPDGTKLEINSERFQLVEPLFDPSIIHIDHIGLPEAIAKVIRTWDRQDWVALLPHIVLAGGGSLIPGLDKRLEIEISKYFSDKLRDNIKVLGASGRENISWIGASVLWAQGKLSKGWEHQSSVGEGAQNIENNI